MRCSKGTSILQLKVAGAVLGELLRKPLVELADLLQHNLQLLGGRQDGHPVGEVGREADQLK